MVNARFKGSRSLRETRETIKNETIVRNKTNLSVKNILNKEKKNRLIIISITIIIKRLEGVVKKANKKIKPKISNKKNIFFPNLPVASLIGFNYNGKL